ncbi:uncharacterized protein LOC126984154 isoform X2 [Eriocheir sinensis]|uniref:uncharacterized protein LOC126984154 isoform X2 n=1 Tax=Eriocheir sinensis TaxID=95602 RepID=UPI0021CA93AE|nr:uncharacterized protein LOC126984154 isoform X2 [Eriocheir sinensis]
MCAARGGPQGDVCHPSSAPGQRPPPAAMQAPASARSLPGPGGGGNPSGHLTKPSPRPLHLQQLPERFTRLGRSPDAEKPDRVWTVRGETGTGPKGPNDVIITDICLNHNPKLSLNTSSVRARQHPTPDIQQLSVVDLQKHATQGPLSPRRPLSPTQPQPATQDTQELRCSFFGAARSFLGRLVASIRSGDLCGGQGEGHQPEPERREEAEVTDDQPEQVPAEGHDATQRLVETQETPRGYDNPVASSSPMTSAAGRIVTPEVVVTPEKSARRSRASWGVLSDLATQQNSAGPTSSSSADPIYSSPGAASHLQPPTEGGRELRAVRSLLDIQREKERAELHPARYQDDLRVLYNIYKRELVSQLVYREAGQIFQREGAVGEPPPLRRVIGSPSNTVTQDDLRARESRKKLIRKIASLRPVVSPRGLEPEPCWEESEFVQSCLQAHNLYRARHSSAPLTLSNKLCGMAQEWVNHLAHTGTLRHRGDPELGENLFCRNTALILRGRTSVMPDITGEEVAAYWYSSVRQYRFNRPSNKLQASQGPFTQMVWQSSREFGVGKARSRSGKVIVVAHYSPPGNIENDFKENVHPLNTRALAAEILGRPPPAAVMEGADGPAVERVMRVLAAQPPRLTGRNATKVIAAHLLGHTVTLVNTPDEELQVVINRPRQVGRRRGAFKRSSSDAGRTPSDASSTNVLAGLPELSCCPTSFRLRARASVSPADVQSSVIHEASEGSDRESEFASPSRNRLPPLSAEGSKEGAEESHTEVIELQRGDLGTPPSDVEVISSLSVSASPKYSSSRSKRPRLKKTGQSDPNNSDSSTDLEVIRRESFDSVDSQSHPEPRPKGVRQDSVAKENTKTPRDGAAEPGINKQNMGLKLPFEIGDAEYGRLNYYALSPMRY